MFTTRNFAKIIFNSTLGIILILIWLQFVDLGKIWETISKVNPLNLLPVIFFLFLSQATRALRLKIFLNQIKNISFFDLIFLNGASTMFNFLIPIRAGEVLKGLYLSNNYQIHAGKALIWIFLDRFIDFLVVLILAAILLNFIPTSLPGNIIFIIITITIVITFFLYLVVYRPNFFQKVVKLLSYLLILSYIRIYFERISNFFIKSFEIFRRNPKELLILFAVTVFAYGADGAIWYFTFLAISSPQEYLKMYLGQLLSALTYLIPAAPGYVGSAEASGILIFSGIFRIEPNLASAMIVLFHVVTAIFVTLFGIISIHFLKIDLQDIWNNLKDRKRR